MRSQLLHPETASTISDPYSVVKSLLGLQAQELPSAVLAVRARSRNLTADDVIKAREKERSIVLTWCMRGTLHLIASDDLGWMLPFFGPIFIQKSKRRYQQLGLDSETLIRAKEIIRETLSRKGALSRAELGRDLSAKGVPVEGQAIAHLVGYAALAGEICFGPEVGGKLTYVLLDDWLPPLSRYSNEKTITVLARRYLQGFGPATPEDLSSWAGVSISEARAGFSEIAEELTEVDAMGSPAWMPVAHSSWLEIDPEGPIVRLLPRYDSYLLGYQNRSWMVAKAYEKRLHPGGGIIHPTWIVDGAAAGLWRSENPKKKSRIVIEPFEPVPPEVLPGLETEVKDIGRFLQREAELYLQGHLPENDLPPL